MPIGRQDALNRSTWSKASSRDWLDSVASHTDEGERVALERIGLALGRAPILDLGVGTGRTIPLLRGLTDDYRAIDYLPSMVAAAHARYPEAAIDVGDARSLDGFPSDHFGLVNFSFNGIDAVGAADRGRVLSAVRRVLQPNGIFFFSTLNLDGPSFRERPWHVAIAHGPTPLRTGVRTARAIAGACLDAVRWVKLRGSIEVGPGYAVAPLRAHHYGVLVHFTTLARELTELAEAGFAPNVDVLDNVRGDCVAPGDDLSEIAWFHLLARRPAAA